MSDAGRDLSLRRRVRRVVRRAALESVLTGRRLTGSSGSLPDFMIIGAQRCGTTSLYRALLAHESILDLALKAKGAHYFDTNADRSTDWYRRHFPSEADRRKAGGRPGLAGESSPYYLFHPTVMARVAEVVPDARLIVLLRDPVARAYSHYQHMVWEGHETLPTFEAAIDAEPERLLGEEAKLAADPTYRSPNHQHYAYVARGMYAAQLERLYEHFAPEQVAVYVTERLVADPVPHLAEIQRFIGVEPSPSVSLRQHNSGSYDRLEPATRERLEIEFADSNRRLTEMTGLDVPWA